MPDNKINTEAQSLASVLPIKKELFSLDADDKMNTSEILDILDRMKKIKDLKIKYQSKIKTRSDGKQVYLYINRKQISAKNETALYEKLYDIEHSVDRYSMADIFPLWLRWKRDYTPVTGKTLQIYTQDWKRFFEPYDIINVPVKNLVAKDFINLFRIWTKNRELSSKKFNNLKSLINGLFSYGINELLIVNINPIREIDMRQFPMRPTNRKDRVFFLDDRNKLLDHLQSIDVCDIDEIYSLAIQFDFYTTLRIGELKALKWCNYRDGNIYVEGQYVLTTALNDDGTFEAGKYKNVNHVKGNTADGFRWIPLPSKAKGILKRVRQINPDGEYIFMYNGKQLYTATFNEHLKEYCKEVGIDPSSKSSHNIRFTVASALYLGGVPLTDIQHWLGHTSLNMTLHYLRQILPSSETVSLMEKCLS